MLLSVTKKTEQHRRVKENEKIIKVTIKPQYTLEKRMERTNIVYFESHNRALQVSGSIFQTGLCMLKWPYCCCTATNTGA